jgi:hypothetical protein
MLLRLRWLDWIGLKLNLISTVILHLQGRDDEGEGHGDSLRACSSSAGFAGPGGLWRLALKHSGFRLALKLTTTAERA